MNLFCACLLHADTSWHHHMTVSSAQSTTELLQVVTCEICTHETVGLVIGDTKVPAGGSWWKSWTTKNWSQIDGHGVMLICFPLALWFWSTGCSPNVTTYLVQEWMAYIKKSDAIAVRKKLCKKNWHCSSVTHSWKPIPHVNGSSINMKHETNEPEQNVTWTKTYKNRNMFSSCSWISITTSGGHIFLWRSSTAMPCLGKLTTDTLAVGRSKYQSCAHFASRERMSQSIQDYRLPSLQWQVKSSTYIVWVRYLCILLVLDIKYTNINLWGCVYETINY